MIARRPHQRGVALLVALLVVALAVILIAALLDRGELVLARTRNLLRSEQAEAYALGLEQYAAQILLAAQADTPNLDTHASPWALPMPPQQVPGGVIGATMRDLNGCFNLNNLSPENSASSQWMRMFEALLTNRGIPAPANLAQAVQGWLGGGDDADEANRYLGLPVPYRPRGDLFVHVSELRLVRGVSGDTYARLAPHVCVLPSGSRINLNTASVPVLWSLSGLDPAITQPVAEKLWNNGQARYGGVEEFAQAANISPASLPIALFGVKSSYFMARGDIVLDDIPFTFHSMIERGNGIRVLERSRGSDDAAALPESHTSGAGGDSRPR